MGKETRIKLGSNDYIVSYELTITLGDEITPGTMDVYIYRVYVENGTSLVGLDYDVLERYCSDLLEYLQEQIAMKHSKYY